MDEDTIKIGQKSAMVYVGAAMHLYRQGKEIKLLARGKLITKAVDVSQILKNNIIKMIEIKEIKIGTVRLKEDNSEREKNVSTIAIILGAN
jgi:DNA-binding protein